MNFENLTTEQLEARDVALTKTRIALYSWANRGLSKRNRARLVEGIREEQKAITEELMKREGVTA